MDAVVTSIIANQDQHLGHLQDMQKVGQYSLQSIFLCRTIVSGFLVGYCQGHSAIYKLQVPPSTALRSSSYRSLPHGRIPATE